MILVEGVSDKIAVETLAARTGRNLDAEDIAVLAIGGAHAIRQVVESFGPDVRVVGLCDVGEEHEFRRALGASFYVCVKDLEDELIRAVGTERVLELLERNGDLRPFRTLQKQAAWQGRPVAEQLRRFMGSGGRRKIRYARFLVEALDLSAVPRPLAGVLAHV